MVTLECTDGNMSEALYVPYGWLAIPITQPDTAAAEAKGPPPSGLSAFWTKTLFVKSHLALMPASQFAAIDLLNRPYLKHLSGQRLWSQRLQAYDAICSDRSAILTGFADAPTMPLAEQPSLAVEDSVTLPESTLEVQAENEMLAAGHPAIFAARLNKRPLATPKPGAKKSLRIAAAKPKATVRAAAAAAGGPGQAAGSGDNEAGAAAAAWAHDHGTNGTD